MTALSFAITRGSPISADTDRGVGEDASWVADRFRGALAGLRHNSVSIGEPRRACLGDLVQVCKECSEENWDGYGARAVRWIAKCNAERFLDKLPTTVPVPDEVSADPDGEISFEWYRKPGWLFSVSVGRNNDLAYAGLFGGNKANGIEHFDDEIPKAIIQQLRRLYS